jgi:3-phenylpropionate/cinnamic acid dioxygenase small subunit
VESWELIARERIRDIVAAYAHCADSGRFDDLVALFDADGVLETPDGQQHRGRDAVRAFLTGTKTHLAATTTAPLIRHHVSNLHLVVTGPDDATGAAYFLVITERGPDHWGRYRDRYVRRDGIWRFAHRRVRLDGYAATSWVAQRRGGEGA